MKVLSYFSKSDWHKKCNALTSQAAGLQSIPVHVVMIYRHIHYLPSLTVILVLMCLEYTETQRGCYNIYIIQIVYNPLSVVFNGGNPRSSFLCQIIYQFQ